MKFRLKGAELVWDFDPENTSAAMISENNLTLVADGGEVWNMRDTVGYDDACVGAQVLSEGEFYFVTFNGLGFTMRYENGKIYCAKKIITK